MRDPETDRVVRQLAVTTGRSITEAIRIACDEALKKAATEMSKEERHARMRAIREELARLPQDDGVVIDKAFFDALNDE